MKNFEDFKDLTIYFIGIGGISMSGLCLLSQHFGAKVSGSDAGTNPEIAKLKARGIIVNNCHCASNINSNIDVVVYTSAISCDNLELLRAKELGIVTMERSEFLGLVSDLYKNVIAISGTHGKTTTTAIIGEILNYAGLKPTIHLGGESVGLKGNTIIGGHDFFVVEACEYKESFRYLKPDIAVITNIELDHLDYYKDYSSIHTAFQKFANNSHQIVMADRLEIEHPNAQIVFRDWEIKQLEFIGGGYNFNVYKKGNFYETFRLNMLGLHNVHNALFAIAIADLIGVDVSKIVRGVAGFQGVERRYETIHAFDSGCRIIIDYAHHFTEIKSSISGIKDIYKKILVVFQPHTYSRTLKLFDDFVRVLSENENIVLYKTYPAREEYIEGGSAEDLYKHVSSKNKKYFTKVDDLISYIDKEYKLYDCILVLGAGDLAEMLKINYLNYINYC